MRIKEVIELYSGVKNCNEIGKAKEREYKKAIKYILDSNYVLHFKMIFEKNKIKLNISEENYINTENVLPILRYYHYKNHNLTHSAESE